jgi:phosphate transport system permease protein
MNRANKDKMMYGLIGLSSAITVGLLLWIIGFVFLNGFKLIDLDFLTSDFDSKTQYVSVQAEEEYSVNKLGVDLSEETYEGSIVYVVKEIEKDSPVLNAINKSGNKYPVKKGDVIKKIGSENTEKYKLEELDGLINGMEKNIVTLKVTRPGDGILPMIVTTLQIIFMSLLVACPIGIFAAIYLTEYAKQGRIVKIIRFATESLAGIPSIIYGLFGMIVFVTILKLDYSILSGSLTLSIILLPVIIRQTEESLKAVPDSYREGSLGLGVTKLQTIRKVVLPNAISGIIVAIILSIGRIVGESAALLLTAGTVARIPKSVFSSGATLTVKAYTVAKEEGNIEMACAIGSVVIIMILILNGMSKLISLAFNKSK